MKGLYSVRGTLDTATAVRKTDMCGQEKSMDELGVYSATPSGKAVLCVNCSGGPGLLFVLSPI